MTTRPDRTPARNPFVCLDIVSSFLSHRVISCVPERGGCSRERLTLSLGLSFYKLKRMRMPNTATTSSSGARAGLTSSWVSAVIATLSETSKR